MSESVFSESVSLCVCVCVCVCACMYTSVQQPEPTFFL